MSSNANESVQVVVVGGGPVGLISAMALGLSGIEVLVLEKEPMPAQHSRASTFHPASLEYFDRLGVASELMALGIRAPVFQLRERRGDVVASFDLGELSNITSFPFRVQCEQHKLCGILRSHLDNMENVEVRFGCEVVAIDAEDDKSVVVCSDGSSVQARVVIAADGAHSKIRDSLKLALEGMTYAERFLIISTSYDISSVIPGLSHVSYLADPDEWAAVIHSPDHWRMLFPVRNSESDAEAARLDRAYQRVADFVDKEDLEDFEVDDITVYRVHRRAVECMVHKRVYLVGDAAHLNNPLGGQGMNSGIHDAVTLAQNLVACFSGALEWDALELWASERKNVASTYVGSDTHANYLALTEKDPVKKAEWRRELAGLVADKDALKAYLFRSAMLNTYEIGGIRK